MSPAESSLDATAGDADMPSPDEFLKPHIILGPREDCTAAEDTGTLLILGPGALLTAEDFEKLAAAIQEAAKDRIRLTVGIFDINWQAMMGQRQGEGDMMLSLCEIAEAGCERIVEAADEHLKLKALSSGRRENVFVAGHSALGPCLVNYGLKNSGGLILLASIMLAGVSGTFPTASTWTRPVLNLSAELDGQQLLTKQAPAIMDAAGNAVKFGLDHIAQYQPVICIPGMNHMQFGPGIERLPFPGQKPADLQPDAAVTHDVATAAAAAVVADFLTVHRGQQEAIEAATDSLRAGVLDTARLIQPFTAAQGRGRVGDLLQRLQQQEESAGAVDPAEFGVLPRAFGGDVLAPSEPSRKWLAHPGELQAAEAFAADVQRRALSELPESALQRLRITAVAHTDEATFLHNQPLLKPLPGRVTALERPSWQAT